MAETATVGELLVRIRADMSDLERGLAKATGATSGFSTRVRPGLRAVQNAFSSLAFSLTGVPGPLGRLSRSLLMFGTGGMVTLGVAAGIGIIALGWRKLTEAIREAEEAAKKAADALLIDPALAQRFALQTRIEQLETRRTDLLRRIGPPLGPGATVEEETIREALQKQLIQVVVELGRLRDALQVSTDNLHTFATVFDQVGRTVAGPLVPSVIAPSAEEFAKFGTRFGGLQELRRGLAPIDMDIAARIGADRWVQKFGKEIRQKYEIARAIGESIGYALADGINAVLSGGNFLKALGRSLLSIAINVASTLAGAAITRALFKGPLPSLSGGGGGEALGRMAAPNPIDFSRFPAATNPLASARDGDWLRFLGASNLQLRQYGFRG